jgi:hypothetical protein
MPLRGEPVLLNEFTGSEYVKVHVPVTRVCVVFDFDERRGRGLG